MDRFAQIGDAYGDIYQVTEAIRAAGLESSNLIIGIDFTKSNEWTGKHSFDGLSLHKISSKMLNPYEHALSIIEKALPDFDEDKLIQCFGFGDVTTHDRKVFNFNRDGKPCVGFEGVLKRYREILPHLNLSGPTSFGPIIKAAIDVVQKSGGLYHILLIIADGQVTGNIGTQSLRWSQQEKETMDAIVTASNYPLSIVMVGVGDGPWGQMKQFDDCIPARKFDNFQFVNYTEIMSNYSLPHDKEEAFALAALMEIPQQYTAIKHLQGESRPKIENANSLILPPPI